MVTILEPGKSRHFNMVNGVRVEVTAEASKAASTTENKVDAALNVLLQAEALATAGNIPATPVITQ